MTARARALVCAGAWGAVLLAAGCGNEEEERVKRSLAAMVEAVEAGDADALMDYVAPDYTDQAGHDQRTAVKRVMTEVEQYQPLKVTLAHLDIDLEEKSGLAWVRFVPEYAGEKDPDRKTRPKYDFQPGQRLRLKLRKDGDRYEVLRAEMGMSFSGALGD
ncbi:MAG: hypothetical protein H6744_08600 [Deltaproteobacteria bacterium]|nr:hypothetical protein [Deltaproteobacteria bacterium]MCB9786737.1 hypothetical protein [Deltaproteobacteria bacterium]